MKLIMMTILSSIFLNASMSRNLNMVYDTSNNMVWQDSADNINIRLSQKEAIQYCEHLKLAGKTTWHLPSRNEYKLIIDKPIKQEHKINKAFKYSMLAHYWTSDTTWRSFGRYGYYFFVKSGNLYYENRNYAKFFRCIRDTD